MVRSAALRTPKRAATLLPMRKTAMPSRYFRDSGSCAMKSWAAREATSRCTVLGAIRRLFAIAVMPIWSLFSSSRTIRRALSTVLTTIASR